MTDDNTTIKPTRLRARTDKTSAGVSTAGAPSAPPAAPTKSATVIKLLLRTRGATSLELIAATDWQPHTIRAFLSGLRKKGRRIVHETRKTGETTFRIETVETRPPPAALAADDAGPVAE